MARDTVILNHLPRSTNFNKLFDGAKPITKPQAGYHYIYRINCGGSDYKDENGNTWSADKAIPKDSRLTTPDSRLSPRGSRNWTNDFAGIPAFFASQRRVFSPVKGTKDWELFRHFRYGKEKLAYEFPLPDGEYLVELFFTEPWLGIGGGMNATGMRLFDVAINGKTVFHDIDIWKEVGTNAALKKTVKAVSAGGKMIISFPTSRSGQAIISAIAIASLKKNIKPIAPPALVTGLSNKHCNHATWLDEGDRQYTDDMIAFRSLPSNLYGADWLQFYRHQATGPITFTVKENMDVFVAIDKSKRDTSGIIDFENTGTEIETDENNGKRYVVYRKRFAPGATVVLNTGNTSPVMLLPVTNMQPAYDLKLITSYRTNVAIISEGVQKEVFAGREAAVVKSNDAVSVQWPVQVGVADMYSVTIKYFYPLEKTLKGTMHLIGAGNTMMAEEPVDFTFTRAGKWNQFTFHTASMINAGNYHVKLVIKNAEGLIISGIEMQ